MKYQEFFVTRLVSRVGGTRVRWHVRALLVPVGCLALLLVAGPTAVAQSPNTYALDWFTLDSGGGASASASGGYTVSGTIGQPDAGVMRGGEYEILGGFWGFGPTPTPDTPSLVITPTTGAVTVRWPRPAPGFVLESSQALAGPPSSWTRVAFPYQTNATHVFVSVPGPVGNKFYRLRRP